MASKVRKQIYIEPHQEALLKQLGKACGLTEAEVIRRAIDQFARASYVPQRDLSAWKAERAFILELLDQGATPGRRTWRREDLHER
ncbi:MAG: hypothetical protein NZ699_14850 [Roseiflexus sp.]|nr:hypothetical protein [Roseiflexus sp.]